MNNKESAVKKIIFCETLPNKFARNGTLHIALKPQVYVLLRQKEVKAHNTLPYFKNNSHEECLRKSEILMNWIRANACFTDLGNEVKDAYREMLIFWLRLAVHYCLWQIEIISNAIDCHGSEIIGAASLLNRKPVSSLYVQAEEGYLGCLTGRIAQARKIAYDSSLICSMEDGQGDSNSWYNSKAMIDFFAGYAKLKLSEARLLVKRLGIRKKPVVFSSLSYHMDKLALRFKKESGGWPVEYLKLSLTADSKILNSAIRIFGRKHRNSIQRQQDIIGKLTNNVKERELLFSFRGICFADLISGKMERDLNPFIMSQTLWSFMLKEHLLSIKPAMVVSNASRGDDMLLAELCRGNRIKNVLVSHGSHSYPKNEFERIEWGEHGKQFLSTPVSHIAMPTPISEGYLRCFPSNAAVVKTGPLIWGTPVNKESSGLLFDRLFKGKYSIGKTKVILHAGTPKASNSLRLYVYETSDEYIQALCDLAYAVKDIPDTLLVIKFRPLSEIPIETIKSLLPLSDKVVLCTEGSFLESLGMADLLVSFSSTAIDEALQNRIPVLLYGGSGRYQHVPAYEIETDSAVEPAAIFHVKERANLSKAAAGILNLGIPANYSLVFDKYIYPRESCSSLTELLK